MLIPVIPYSQQTAYSCSAAVLQMVVRHFTGRRMLHGVAVHATRCRPDGCMMADLRKVIHRYGLKTRKIAVRIRAFRQALDQGRLVVVDDNRTYVDSHVILAIGHTPQGFWVVDPVKGKPTRPACRRVVRAAEEAFTVYGNSE